MTYKEAQNISIEQNVMVRYTGELTRIQGIEIFPEKRTVILVLCDSYNNFLVLPHKDVTVYNYHIPF